MRRNNRVDYPAAVVDALVGEFPDLADPLVADIVRQAVARYVDDPYPSFECIIDDPIAANWRLRADRVAPKCVRVSCHRVMPTPADIARESRLNETLRAILR